MNVKIKIFGQNQQRCFIYIFKDLIKGTFIDLKIFISDPDLVTMELPQDYTFTFLSIHFFKYLFTFDRKINELT